MLMKILIEDFPSEEDIEAAIQEAKSFSKWAREEELNAHVTSIKNILTGDNEIFEAMNTHEDSIMADIEKIPITKTQDCFGESVGYGQSKFDFMEKSEFQHSRMGNSECPIALDDQEDAISDFEEPGEMQERSVGEVEFGLRSNREETDEKETGQMQTTVRTFYPD